MVIQSPQTCISTPLLGKEKGGVEWLWSAADGHFRGFRSKERKKDKNSTQSRGANKSQIFLGVFRYHLL